LSLLYGRAIQLEFQDSLLGQNGHMYIEITDFSALGNPDGDKNARYPELLFFNH
jgi:hypothetical protein